MRGTSPWPMHKIRHWASAN